MAREKKSTQDVSTFSKRPLAQNITQEPSSQLSKKRSSRAISYQVVSSFLFLGGFLMCIAVIFWEKVVPYANHQIVTKTETFAITAIPEDQMLTYQTDTVSFRHAINTRQRVESDNTRWYDQKRDIGLELDSVPSSYQDPLVLVDAIMDGVRKDSPEVVYGGHEFLYRNGLVGVMLLYEKIHNGERQTYLGQYFPTPSSLVSLVAFTPRETFHVHASFIKETFLGFSPQWNPVAIADDIRWTMTAMGLIPEEANLVDSDLALVGDDGLVTENDTDRFFGSAPDVSNSGEIVDDSTLDADISEAEVIVPESILPFSLSIDQSIRTNALPFAGMLAQRNHTDQGTLQVGIVETSDDLSTYWETYRSVLVADAVAFSYEGGIESSASGSNLLLTYTRTSDMIPLTTMHYLSSLGNQIVHCIYTVPSDLFEETKNDAKYVCTSIAAKE